MPLSEMFTDLHLGRSIVPWLWPGRLCWYREVASWGEAVEEAFGDELGRITWMFITVASEGAPGSEEGRRSVGIVAEATGCSILVVAAGLRTCHSAAVIAVGDIATGRNATLTAEAAACGSDLRLRHRNTLAAHTADLTVGSYTVSVVEERRRL